MSNHAETCPICKGKGEILKDDKYYQCYGCIEGRGWIEVSGVADESVIDPEKRLLCEVPDNQKEMALNG